MQSKNFRKIILGTLIAFATTACENPGGGQYNKVVKMPEDCVKPLSAGFSSSISQSGIFQTSYDWLSCFDANGNIRIYRMNKNGDKWYSTTIEKG
ncbi:MAG: hypothetical protein HYU56_05600 [Candidatus Aenigmarchaeota archaeon]|nr:hypothetical protein [Candidatus Aenigmarchaeota archaeon]